ncbi:hypothetical protein CDL15_Pgr001367 [Punica granatum]|uniref:Uncharacterized protein n=1 Tax=Punica granatum TaxID=22663 RepID=A0A218WKZ2_PUNGR|nr:hypothetical protein CDL15_Pgr001367 [Punica granatum]
MKKHGNEEKDRRVVFSSISRVNLCICIISQKFHAQLLHNSGFQSTVDILCEKLASLGREDGPSSRDDLGKKIKSVSNLSKKIKKDEIAGEDPEVLH